MPGVGRENACGETARAGALEERDSKFIVVGHVELEEAGPGAVGGAYVFDWGAAGCGKAVGEVELFGDGGDGEFAEGMVDFVDADWREADGCGDFVAEDCGGCVAGIGVDKLTGDYAVAEEGGAVGKVSVGLAGIGGGVVPVEDGEFRYGRGPGGGECTSRPG